MMEKHILEKIICAGCNEKHKTLDDYIDIAEKFNIRLSVEDLMELEKAIKIKEEKCKENN